MISNPTKTERLLETLIAFATLSRESNLDLIDFVADYLSRHNVVATRVFSEVGTQANLHAIIGPADIPGVMLSGHTDVVPVAGQDWTSDPFEMRVAGDKLTGRGSADMKGFIASVLAAVPEMVKADLKRPIHLAFSYDEEVGCIGVRRLIDMLQDVTPKPAFCIIGEPTGMRVATAHKGKVSGEIICTGKAGHSSLPAEGVNAIYLAGEMLGALRELQAEIIEETIPDTDYLTPYSSVHAGIIKGGVALNVIPDECRITFEIRQRPEDDPEKLLDRLREKAAHIVDHWGHPDAGIEIRIATNYPAFSTPLDHEAVRFVTGLTGDNDLRKLDFGTEAGLFQRDLGVSGVVCGPGDIAQAHKADEFVTRDQLGKCDLFLEKLIAALS
ncbi:MAG: acetylornithine deacetylase [Rhizobiales bacterium]|nr:acetylornithine deacetylase [Hyphomicrobiales bacterium]